MMTMMIFTFAFFYKVSEYFNYELAENGIRLLALVKKQA